MGKPHRNNILTCSVEGCNKQYNCRGYCKSHYYKSYRGQLPKGVSLSEDKKLRYMRKIDIVNGCWIWKGSKFQKSGYGSIRTTDKMRVAHAVIYELYKGEVPKGLELDHLCRVHLCVNPDHLEPVTHEENMRRSSVSRNITRCPQGHDYDEKNTYVNPLGRKICRKCTNEAGKRYRARKLGIL